MTERRVKVPSYLRQPFQSEYDRLNVDATPPGIDVRTQKPLTQNAPVRPFHGDTGHPRRGRHSVPQEPRPSQEKPVRMTRPAPPPQLQEEMPPPLHMREVRHVDLEGQTRMPVQVGNHEDQMWFDDELVATGQRAPEDRVDNNDVMNIPGEHLVQRLNNRRERCQLCGIEQERGRSWGWECPANPRPAMTASGVGISNQLKEDIEVQEHIQAHGSEEPADDTSRWVRAHEQAEQTVHEEERSEFQLGSMKSSEYLVLYKNQIIYQGPSEGTAKKAVESVLLQFQPSTEDIVVLKRIEVDFGVSFL
jgi:hypothetical protein